MDSEYFYFEMDHSFNEIFNSFRMLYEDPYYFLLSWTSQEKK